jgi:hypothetical protein
MLTEHVRIAVTELVQEPRGSLHVGEKKRDGAGGQVGHIGMMRRLPRKV